MKIPNWTRLDRLEFKDMPKSIEKLLAPLNSQLSKLTTALQGGVDGQNLALEVRVQNVRHGEEVKLELQDPRFRPTAAYVVYADNYPNPVPILSWVMSGTKSLKFTCYFLDQSGAFDPAGQANVRVEFRA